jgi:hypothetical protein
MQNDLRHIEFLAAKSKDFIDKQIGAYRQKQTNSGSIMAIISLFIPFFLSGLDEAYIYVKLISIIPVGLFVYGIFAFIEVLKSRSLDQGFHTNKFQDLVNLNDYKKVLLYEIGANQSSFNDNTPKVNKANNIFDRGIKVTTLAVLFAIGLLLTNKFFKPQKSDTPIKVQLIKT